MPYNTAWGNFIPNGAINEAIASWQSKQPDRVQTSASPSTLLECPRVVWLKKHAVEPTNTLGWGKKQRFLLGRQLESMIAGQLEDEGLLLHWWQDDKPGDSIKFEHGEGLDKITGTPDLLLKIGDKVAISDSKTSRSDSFKYVPIDDSEIWEDPYWYRYKLQLTAYYMLCHWNKDWFTGHKKALAGHPFHEVQHEPDPLSLPEVCHLFSYALDDGIVRRELIWKPTKEDMLEVGRLTRRWNAAYASETMPDCTCTEDDSVKFCAYGIMEDGKKICSSCCDDKLNEGVK